MKFLLISVAAILLVIILAFLFLKSSNISLPPARPQGDHMVTASAKQDLLSSLQSSDQIISFRNPDVLSWSPGETGSFALAIKNPSPQPKTLFLSVAFERGVSHSETSDWFSYPASITLPAGGVEAIDIFVNPSSPVPGPYFYRILVCSSPQCDISSPSLYATTTFVFEIR